MQREFDKRVQSLTVVKIGETASATQRVEAHVIEKVEPGIQRTENLTTETLVTAKDIQKRGRRMDEQMSRVSDTVETQGDILLNIREMLRDLLSNNECM
jgi:methyl-accepting chemotaxis protein